MVGHKVLHQLRPLYNQSMHPMSPFYHSPSIILVELALSHTPFFILTQLNTNTYLRILTSLLSTIPPPIEPTQQQQQTPSVSSLELLHYGTNSNILNTAIPHLNGPSIVFPTTFLMLLHPTSSKPNTNSPDTKRIPPHFPYANGRRHRHRPDHLARQHTADLIIATFFFACRSCEYVATPTPGVTRRLRLRNIIFRDKTGRIIAHDDPTLRSAAMVTVCFEYTKNGSKMERRTQRRTNDRTLCPVIRFASIVQRIHQHVPNSGPDTPICTTLDDALRPVAIDNTFTLSFLRSTCLDYGGTTTFGFGPMDIGNKSLRSGAAMALFMARHSPDRIMLMGRWKSTSFLDYLRPQVLEWTHNMALDMIQFDRFFDLDHSSPSKSTLRPLRDTDNGRESVDIHRFNMDFDRESVEILRFNMDFDRVSK